MSQHDNQFEAENAMSVFEQALNSEEEKFAPLRSMLEHPEPSDTLDLRERFEYAFKIATSCEERCETVTVLQLDELVWDVLSPIADLTSPIENILEKTIDFKTAKTPITVFIEPQGSMIELHQPVMVAQFMETLQHVVQITDDCTLWVGMQEMVDCEENRQSWVQFCNDNTVPLPDFVVLLEE